MLSDKDVWMQRERYRDLLRDAEHDRLLQQVHTQNHGQDRLHSQALNWLGRRLVMWGMSLQERYGSMTAQATESASLNIHQEGPDWQCC